MDDFVNIDRVDGVFFKPIGFGAMKPFMPYVSSHYFNGFTFRA
jgi:hypothetical protein